MALIDHPSFQTGEHVWTWKPCVIAKFFTPARWKPVIIMFPYMFVLYSQTYCWSCDMLWFWTSLFNVSPSLQVQGPKQNRVYNDPLINLQEVTTHREDVYFIHEQLGHAVTVNKAMRYITTYFGTAVSKWAFVPERGGLTVRALFKSTSPDECCEEHFKCQQTMFLTC